MDSIPAFIKYRAPPTPEEVPSILAGAARSLEYQFASDAAAARTTSESAAIKYFVRALYRTLFSGDFGTGT